MIQYQKQAYVQNSKHLYLNFSKVWPLRHYDGAVNSKPIFLNNFVEHHPHAKFDVLMTLGLGVRLGEFFTHFPLNKKLFLLLIRYRVFQVFTVTSANTVNTY